MFGKSPVNGKYDHVERWQLPVLEDHAFLDCLVDTLELLDVWFVGVDASFVLLEATELVFQRSLK